MGLVKGDTRSLDYSLGGVRHKSVGLPRALRTTALGGHEPDAALYKTPNSHTFFPTQYTPNSKA